MSVTPADFYREMQILRDHIDDKHQSLRASMENRFDVLSTKLDDHARDDRLVETRVHTIEVERHAEKGQAVKRATYIGMLSAMLTQAALSAFRYFTEPR